MIENLESGSLNYVMVEEFLLNLNKKFRRGDNEIMKIVELKKIKQGSKIIEEFFRTVIRESEYKGRLFVEKLKRYMNKQIK